MERRIVAQFLSSMDDIAYDNLKGPVFIIGATNKPEYLDSALRRSGRFDKEINIGFPNENNREEMLIAMTKTKKIDNDISFMELAKLTPGYLAADLEALIREAGLCAVRRIGKLIDTNKDLVTPSNENISKLENSEENISEINEKGIVYTITMNDFLDVYNYKLRLFQGSSLLLKEKGLQQFLMSHGQK